jgi:ABC-type Fe3+ transport system permease subunit
MLIIVLCLAVYALALGIETLREALRALPGSNQDWVWY